jgi:hypothetical protein
MRGAARSVWSLIKTHIPGAEEQNKTFQARYEKETTGARR